MLIISIVNVFAIFFALFASYTPNNKKYFIFSFLLIFIFLAIRYDFGNDYMAYYYYFSDVHQTSVKDLLSFKDYQSLGLKEFGYTWLNKVFPSFYLMVAFLSLFSCYIYYYSIKSYVTQRLMWFSVFIFLVNPSLMLVQSSAMRQTVAIGLFLYSIKYLIERNIWKYCMLILLGSLFHVSAIVLLPMYLIVTPKYWSRGVMIALVICFVFVAFFGYIFLESIGNISRQYFPAYEDAYMTDIIGNPLKSGLGFLFLSCTFLFILWSHNKGVAHNIVISKLSIIGFVLSPIGMYLNMFGRIGMYFEPAIILSLPFAISLQKSWQNRIIIISVFVLFYLFNFYEFFQNPIWVEKFSTYKTFLFRAL